MDLCNKTVLITGAAGGLGGAIAIELAARGAKLALVDLDKTKLEPMCRTRLLRKKLCD